MSGRVNGMRDQMRASVIIELLILTTRLLVTPLPHPRKEYNQDHETSKPLTRRTYTPEPTATMSPIRTSDSEASSEGSKKSPRKGVVVSILTPLALVHVCRAF
jgi:hypothetical protein